MTENSHPDSDANSANTVASSGSETADAPSQSPEQPAARRSPWHHNGYFVAALMVLILFAGGGIGYAIALNDFREAVQDTKAQSRHYEGKKRSHSRPEVRSGGGSQDAPEMSAPSSPCCS